MTQERTLELLNKVVDQMIEREGLRPRRVIMDLLELGFSPTELIELNFAAGEVLDLAAEFNGAGLEHVIEGAQERSAEALSDGPCPNRVIDRV